MDALTIKTDKTLGKIKPMHAVNNGPLGGAGWGNWDLMKNAGIPYARLHDTGGAYGGHVYVDIANVFRNFDADPSNPENYDFAFTDWLMKSLTENGAEPFYRLGSTIENAHWIKPYNIFPPKDNLKWAKICEGIIRHYTEGWGNGFNYKITYWEIWNEPDNMPDIQDNPMWKGTKEQFFEMYQVASSYLKEKFPHLKIGGYASCGFYKIANLAADPNANISPRVEYFISFFEDFLKYIKDPAHPAPLDFFSWHSYSGVSANLIYSNYARAKLDEYGFTQTEHILNEWNPSPSLRGTLKDAVNVATNMLALHRTTVSMLMYYDWRLYCTYNGAINPLNFTPFKCYYSFVAFNELYRLGTEVETTISGDNLQALSATDGKTLAIMMANDSDNQKNIEINGVNLTDAEVLLIDDTHTYEPANEIIKENVLTLPPLSVILIKIKK